MSTMPASRSSAARMTRHRKRRRPRSLRSGLFWKKLGLGTSWTLFDDEEGRGRGRCSPLNWSTAQPLKGRVQSHSAGWITIEHRPAQA